MPEWDWNRIRWCVGIVLVLVVIVVAGTVIGNRAEAAKPQMTIVFGFGRAAGNEAITASQDSIKVYNLVRWPDGQLFIPVATQGSPKPAHPVLVATTDGKVMTVDIEYWRNGNMPRLYNINGHYALEALFH